MLQSLPKSVLVPLGLTAAVSATDAAIEKKIFGSGTTRLVSSNDNLNDIMTIAESLEDAGLLIKRVSETIKIEVKEQKGGLFSMLLGTLGASLMGNLSTDTSIVAGEETISAGESTIRADQDFQKNTLARVKDGAYVIHLDEYESMGTHCIALYANGYNITYSDSFGIKHIPKKIKKLRTKKNITKTIYRLQTNNSIMCGYFCILFIDFMLKGKS